MDVYCMTLNFLICKFDISHQIRLVQSNGHTRPNLLSLYLISIQKPVVMSHLFALAFIKPLDNLFLYRISNMRLLFPAQIQFPRHFLMWASCIILHYWYRHEISRVTILHGLQTLKVATPDYRSYLLCSNPSDNKYEIILTLCDYIIGWFINRINQF